MAASPEQLHELLTYCMDFARIMLKKAGDFYPFGATLSPDGKVSATGGYNGEEHPQPQEIYRLLAGAFRSGAGTGEFLGVALAANVNIPAQFAPVSPDGIRVHIEASDYSRFVYLPYQIKASGLFKKTKTIEFGEPFSVEVPPNFFAASGTGK
jgi:hypothetical protein